MGIEREATVDDWIKACAVAWRCLCRAEEGAAVRDGETWPCAIARCAGRVLVVWDYRRPRGAVPEAWLEVVEMFAGRHPCSADGLVQTHDGRKFRDQLRKPPVEDPPAIIVPDDTPRIIVDGKALA